MQHNAMLSIVAVTIKSPLCTDIIEAACGKPGATAEKAERDKISKYKPFTDTKPATAFVPFGMEAYGRLGPAASKFLNDLWDHADVGAEVRPKLINYCLATLSVGLLKGHVRRLERMGPPGVSDRPEQVNDEQAASLETSE